MDRFTRGLLAGAVATAFMDGLDYMSKVLTSERIAFWDYFDIFLFRRMNPGLLGDAMGFLTQFAFASVMGVLFAYLVPEVTSRLYLLKGWLFGAALWFLIYTVSTFYKVRLPDVNTPTSAAAHLLFTSAYGLVLAALLSYLDQRTRVS